MRRQSLIEYAQPLQATEVPTPTPSGTEVLLRVTHCGVCHSDIHLQDGYFDLGGGQKLDVRSGRPMPFTFGHEIAGTVEAAGPDAKGVDMGKRYAAYPWIGCGKCGLCARGDEHMCNAPRALGHHRRRRLCHACAGAASALPARRGGDCAGDRRPADVFGAYRATARSRRRCRTSSAGPLADCRARRRRHDGAAVCPRADRPADLCRRHRREQARGSSQARRQGSFRPGRSQPRARPSSRRRAEVSARRSISPARTSRSISPMPPWPRAARPSSSA